MTCSCFSSLPEMRGDANKNEIFSFSLHAYLGRYILKWLHSKILVVTSVLVAPV